VKEYTKKREGEKRERERERERERGEKRRKNWVGDKRPEIDETGMRGRVNDRGRQRE
jgi:hypothetical protein